MDIEAARAEVARVTADLEDIHDARLSPQNYRVALQRFRDVYGMLDAVQRADLLAYLLDSVTVNGAEMIIGLLGQTQDVGQIDALTTEAEKYSQPSIWLPLRRRRRTTLSALSIPKNASTLPNDFRSTINLGNNFRSQLTVSGGAIPDGTD
jgi:hypothetical protein